VKERGVRSMALIGMLVSNRIWLLGGMRVLTTHRDAIHGQWWSIRRETVSWVKMGEISTDGPILRTHREH
jgi:hypothetical protein